MFNREGHYPLESGELKTFSQQLRTAFTRQNNDAPYTAWCPDAETIWSAINGDLSKEETGEVVDHISHCPACARDWRLAHHLQQNAGLTAPGKVVPFPRKALTSAWAVSAVAMAACFLLFFNFQVPTEATTHYRNSGEEGIAAVGAIAMPRDQFTLDWDLDAPNAVYDLQLTTEDPMIIRAVVTDLEKSEWRVPVEKLKSLPKDGAVFWRVTARLPDGSKLSSRTFESTVQ